MKKIFKNSLLLFLGLSFLGSCAQTGPENPGGDPVETIKAESLSVEGTPSKTYYRLDEKFDPTGLKFYLNLDNNTKLEVEDYNLTFGDIDFTNDTPKVEITYNGQYGKVSTTFSKGLYYNKVTKLEVINAPKNTTYAAGEKIDVEGINLLATYADGYRRPVLYDEVTYEPEIVQKDTTSIKVLYGGSETSFAITKISITKIDVKIDESIKDFYLEDNFSIKNTSVTATYDNGKTRILSLEELGFSIDGEKIDPNTYIFKSPKTYKLDILFNNESIIDQVIDINVRNAYLIEAEDFYSSGVKPNKNNYVEKVSGNFSKYTDSSTAHGKAYVGGIATNDVMKVHFNSSSAKKGAVAVCFANTNIDKGMLTIGEVQLNKLIAVKFNGKDFNIPDSMVLKKETSYNGQGDGGLWFRWQEVSFGQMDILSGENTIEIKFIVTENRPVDNYVMTPNVDYIKVNFENNGEPQEDKPSTIELNFLKDKNNLSLTATLDYSLVTATLVYVSGIKNPKNIQELNWTLDGETLAWNSTFLAGKHTLEASLPESDAKASADIYVINSLKLEAEDFYENEADIPAGAKNYALRTQGNCRGAGDFPSTSSGGEYLGYISKGDTIEYHFYGDEAGKTATFKIRVANGDIEEGRNGNPYRIGEMKLNELISLKVNGKDLAIDDSIVLEGYTSPDGQGHFELWCRWLDEITFGQISTVQGDNVVELKFIVEKTRGIDGQVAAPNVDYLLFEY